MSFVTCKFLGRLANNVIQVMATIGYAKKYNVQWFIPRNYHHKDIFRFGLPLLRGQKHCIEYRENWTEEIGYQEIPKHDQCVTLVGFFQSEKYFSHATEEIHAAFHRLNDSHTVRHMMEGICSIHVRRGDYLQYPTRFVSPSIQYIGNAVEEMKSHGLHRFKVYSDDIQWCKDNFHFSGDFSFSENTDPIYDLQEMAHADGNIICASTFGWVPAWLNKNSPVVVAPKVWFGPDTKLTSKEIIPENWIKI